MLIESGSTPTGPESLRALHNAMEAEIAEAQRLAGEPLPLPDGDVFTWATEFIRTAKKIGKGQKALEISVESIAGSFKNQLESFDEQIREMKRETVDLKGERSVLMGELLHVIDFLDGSQTSAEKAGDTELSNLISSWVQVITDRLALAGITEIPSLGMEPDLQVHQIVSQRQTGGAALGSVVKVLERGFQYKGKTIRTAKVVIAE